MQHLAQNARMASLVVIWYVKRVLQNRHVLRALTAWIKDCVKRSRAQLCSRSDVDRSTGEPHRELHVQGGLLQANAPELRSPYCHHAFVERGGRT